MRTLTVVRKKAFLGCAGTVMIYAEDRDCPELTIGGIPCKKLGQLKNGESGTYEITENEVRIFTIAAVETKDAFNDCRTLESGDRAVTLTGGYGYGNNGENIFRFDDNPDGGAYVDKQLKKDVNKRIVLGAVICGTLAAIVGLLLSILR